MIYHFILKGKLKKIEYEVLLSFNIHFYVKMKTWQSSIEISYIIIEMLPKLQQSSLAQSLRRDNPALLIQGKC